MDRISKVSRKRGASFINWIQGVLTGMGRLLLGSFIVLSGCVNVNAQEKETYPRVGNVMPDYHFHDVSYYDRPSVSLSDFKGKWLVLDFWDRSCGTCIRAMPRLDRIQNDFKGTVQVLLIGLNMSFTAESEKRLNPQLTGDDYIRALYKKVRATEGVTLPIAWDTVLFRRLLGLAVPYTVIIDPSGRIAGLTSSFSEADMRSLVEGRKPVLTPYTLTRSDSLAGYYEFGMPLLTTGGVANGGMDTAFMYRALLMKAQRGIRMYSGMSYLNGTFEVTNVPLWYMYRVAFTGVNFWDFRDTIHYGKYSSTVILETRDSVELRHGQQYSYSLTLHKIYDTTYPPPTNRDRTLLEEICQRDLAINFPYSACLENRPTMFYHLRVLDSAKVKLLKSKGGDQALFLRSTEITMKNIPIRQFVGRLLARTSQAAAYIVDETGINENIDMQLDVISADLGAIQRALVTVGLELTADVMLQKTVVVRDIKTK